MVSAAVLSVEIARRKTVNASTMSAGHIGVTQLDKVKGLVINGSDDEITDVVVGF